MAVRSLLLPPPTWRLLNDALDKGVIPQVAYWRWLQQSNASTDDHEDLLRHGLMSGQVNWTTACTALGRQHVMEIIRPGWDLLDALVDSRTVTVRRANGFVTLDVLDMLRHHRLITVVTTGRSWVTDGEDLTSVATEDLPIATTVAITDLGRQYLPSGRR